MAKHDRDCTAAPTTQADVGIGHNGGPELTIEQMFALVGPRKFTVIEPFQCGAPWTGYATDDELRQLAVDQGRIERAERRVKEMKARRNKTMNRCIRRMRREQGKD